VQPRGRDALLRIVYLKLPLVRCDA
jgi:hypothetical protein